MEINLRTFGSLTTSSLGFRRGNFDRKVWGGQQKVHQQGENPEGICNEYMNNSKTLITAAIKFTFENGLGLGYKLFKTGNEGKNSTSFVLCNTTFLDRFEVKIHQLVKVSLSLQLKE